MIGLFRLLLALGVSYAHAGEFLGGPARSFVSAFFILSGYLITLTLNRNYSTSAPFYWNRFLRIAPLHVVALIASIAILAPALSDIPGALFLIPEYAYRINAPSWTIGFELLFYLLAPVIVYRLSAIIGVLSGCLIVLAYTGNLGNIAEGFMLSGQMFGSTAVVVSMAYFMAGALLYHAKKIKFPHWALIATFIGILSLSRYEAYTTHVHILVTVTTVVALLSWKTEHAWSKYLGELCYPVYMMHWPLFHLMGGKTAALLAVALAIVWVQIETKWVRKARLLVPKRDVIKSLAVGRAAINSRAGS